VPVRLLPTSQQVATQARLGRHQLLPGCAKTRQHLRGLGRPVRGADAEPAGDKPSHQL